MARRIRWLLAFFLRAGPRGARPSGWALALDGAVAAGAAAGAVLEMAQRHRGTTAMVTVSGSVAAVLEHQPDVVLLDIRMPRVDGIEATRRIVSAWPPSPALADVMPSYLPPVDGRPRIIILTTFDLDEYVYAALTAGASGFLLKDVTPEHLVAAIQLVRTGDALLAPSITRRLVERFTSVPAAQAPPAPEQPRRELITRPEAVGYRRPAYSGRRKNTLMAIDERAAGPRAEPAPLRVGQFLFLA